MEIKEERERVWKGLLDARSAEGLISVAAKVFELSDGDLDILAGDLISRGKALTPLEEWIAVYAKHATWERGKIIVRQRQAKEDHPYRQITAREARRARSQRPQ